MNAPRFPVRLLAALACACPLLAGAQEFAALVSPPRFEATARAGTTYRDVIEINNVTAQRATVPGTLATRVKGLVARVVTHGRHAGTAHS